MSNQMASDISTGSVSVFTQNTLLEESRETDPQAACVTLPHGRGTYKAASSKLQSVCYFCFTGSYPQLTWCLSLQEGALPNHHTLGFRSAEMSQLPYSSALHPSFIWLPLLPWRRATWGSLAATDPGVTAVHLCHQAYVGTGCGFSEQLQMLISLSPGSSTLRAPPAPPPVSQPSPGCHICVLQQENPLLGVMPHTSTSLAPAPIWKLAAMPRVGLPCVPQHAHRQDRGKLAVPVRLILLIFPGPDFPSSLRVIMGSKPTPACVELL